MAWQIEGSDRTGQPWVYRWDRAIVMGVVNVTPDSFSDGGRYVDTDAAIAHAHRLIGDGAAIIDVGGESTRPGAEPVGDDAEVGRVVPVIEALADHVRSARRAEPDGSTGPRVPNVLISVDTRHATVAERAIEAGAHIVNDVAGLRSAEMVDVCATANVPAIIMHMLGEPATMQVDPQYDDVVAEVTEWLADRAQIALAAGIPSVVVDPGIGFGKRLVHNVALLDAVGELSAKTGLPALIGASRKRFLGELTGVTDPARRDVASVAAHLHAVERGAAIVRAHDVASHVQALAVAAAWQR